MKVFTVDENPWAGPWLYTGGDDNAYAPDGSLNLSNPIDDQNKNRDKELQTAAQRQRILAIVGRAGKAGPSVSDKTLACYFQHLANHLQLPFLAWYPEPGRFEDASEYECSITEVCDPKQVLGDPFDGIFCRSRKENYENNLPLVELTVPEDSVNFQLLDDYRHWFWTWRTP
jgi:hypothetical protein